jgi:ABC-type antimicrobial peptide transport system permease subunit
MLFKQSLISLGLIPRSFASIFLATHSQIKKEYRKSVNL